MSAEKFQGVSVARRIEQKSRVVLSAWVNPGPRPSAHTEVTLLDLSTSIRSAMDRATTASARLHRATDALNKKIAEVETALVAQNLGVEARVTLETSEDLPSTVILAFAKRNKHWGLLIEITVELDDFETTQAPIANASRDHRLAAVHALPELIETLALAAESQLASVQSATAAATAIVDALTQPDDDGEIPF